MWINAAEDGFHFVTGHVLRPPRPKPLHQTACGKLYSPIATHARLPSGEKPCAECATTPRASDKLAAETAEDEAAAAAAAAPDPAPEPPPEPVSAIEPAVSPPVEAATTPEG